MMWSIMRVIDSRISNTKREKIRGKKNVCRGLIFRGAALCAPSPAWNTPGDPFALQFLVR